MALNPGLRIIPYNLADLAALSCSPALATALPVGNLQRSEPERLARSTSGTGTWSIKGSWNAAQAVSACVLLRHNLTTDAQWRFRLWLEEDQSGLLMHDSGTVDMLDIIPIDALDWGTDPFGETRQAHWLGAAQSRIWMDEPVLARSFRLDISESDNPAGYWQAWRLVIGRHWAPVDNLDWGAQISSVDESTRVRTDGGSSRLQVQGVPYRRLSWSMSLMPEADRAGLLDIVRYAGARREVYVSAYAGWGGRLERDFELLGAFEGVNGSAHTSAVGWGDRLTVVEV